MAANADTANGELKQTPEPSRTSPDKENVELTSATESDVSDEPAEDYQAAVDDEPESDDAAPGRQPKSRARLATVVGLVAVVILATLVGWLGFRAHQSHQAQQQRELFVQVGRQGALNLTTIDWQHADTDVQRILDSATGAFYDDFSKRQQPFIDVVKKAQAKSVGKITEAGLESESGDEAQVLVAVSVNTSNLGAAEQEPRSWRMRLSVQKVGNEMKISNITFVP
jgi:Mce-associated membrane protein